MSEERDKTAGMPSSGDTVGTAGEAPKETAGTVEGKEQSGQEQASANAEPAAPAAPSSAEASAAPVVDPEREAKLKAAAEAREARAAAKAKAESEAVPEEPKAPSPKQPILDAAVGLIRTEVAEDAVEEAYINELNGHMPVIVVKGDRWSEVAALMKNHAALGCNYLRNVTGVDCETHMEAVYHLVSLESKQDYAIKIKTDREAPSVASATPIWATANWNEREIYDLLGINFPGHPDMRRIMMPDDWVGHPLRKDYEPLDPEV
ncbi:NADH-quinone oxidoreductase subunit C [Paenibacillus oenotherae]|uniref:NADH-quinone oxidoreductase n=1 Tax=Paenibacillus oenotherae TaxID=1435645 RepID=A0ABS7D6B3_9BACL|nr:NADH-quinone oxidoreductase subunit C [Paenibacillus oenotherae]MBW7475041.1 NADH-quinone oxidoreductase subunit C [Paenibacillus oenotherae]